jgi:hypothetical protein
MDHALVIEAIRSLRARTNGHRRAVG